MIKITLPKDKVKEVEIKREVRVYKDKGLKKVVPAMEEVVEKAEEERQEKRTMLLARTKEDINAELRARDNPLEMVSEYMGTTKPATFHCLNPDCNKIWTTKATKVINRKIDCKWCRRRLKLLAMKEEIDKKLTKRFIIMVGEFKGLEAHTKFECLVPGCGYKWSVRASDVINGSGCKRCDEQEKLTEEEIDRRLASRKIKRISPYIGSQEDMTFKCLKEGCGCEWTAICSRVVRRKDYTGCCGRLCGGNKKLSREVFNEIMKKQDRDIIMVGEYVNNHTKTECHCLNPECKNIWRPFPHNTLRGIGCPGCSAGKLEKRVKQLIIDTFIFVNTSKKTYRINKHDRRPDMTIVREGKSNIIVEVNGRQHYMPVTFGGISKKQAAENFKIQVKRDKDVDKYFKRKNIPVIWIKYTMTEEEIISVLSNYLEKKI